MTNWEKWCEELKNTDIKNKANFICHCGLYNLCCDNVVTGKKCPLFDEINCTEKSKFLESEDKVENE